MEVVFSLQWMSHGPGSGVHRLLFLLWNNELPSLLRQRRKNRSSETGPSHISSVLEHLLHYIIGHYAEASLHTLLLVLSFHLHVLRLDEGNVVSSVTCRYFATTE